MHVNAGRQELWCSSHKVFRGLGTWHVKVWTSHMALCILFEAEKSYRFGRTWEWMNDNRSLSLKCGCFQGRNPISLAKTLWLNMRTLGSSKQEISALKSSWRLLQDKSAHLAQLNHANAELKTLLPKMKILSSTLLHFILNLNSFRQYSTK